MLVSRKRTYSLPPPILYVSGTPLQRVPSVRYLGIELTQDLSWSLHISHLCAKARQLIGLLYIASTNMLTDTLFSNCFYQTTSGVLRNRVGSAPLQGHRSPGESSTFRSSHVYKKLVCWLHSVILTVSDASPYSPTIKPRLDHLFKIVSNLCDFPSSYPTEKYYLYEQACQSTAAN
jgi:hypothetical protein